MKTILTSIVAILAMLAFIPAATAQGSRKSTDSSLTSNPRMRVQVKLEKLSFYPRQSPSVSTGDDPRPVPKPKKWGEFEIPFKVEAKPEPKSGYIDSLTFKFFIAVVNPDRAKQYLKLTKEIKYVNVPVGETTYATVYLSPSSIRRLTGSEAGKSDRWVKFEGVVVEYNGKEVACYSNKTGKEERWWEVTSPFIVETDFYPLLNKDETPFAPYWYDRYPEILKKQDSETSFDAPPATPFGSPTES